MNTTWEQISMKESAGRYTIRHDYAREVNGKQVFYTETVEADRIAIDMYLQSREGDIYDLYDMIRNDSTDFKEYIYNHAPQGTFLITFKRGEAANAAE